MSACCSRHHRSTRSWVSRRWIRRFNLPVLAEYLQNSISACQVHETFYQGIRRLPPAHTLSVTGGTLALSRYWDPVPTGFAWASEEDLSRFTPVLTRAVNRCLSVGADSVALSGGFDSVSVAAVAAGKLRGGAPLHAVSLRFTDASCDEAETQTQVARALGMPLLMRSLDECVDAESFTGDLQALSRVSPNPVLSPWQPMYNRLLRSAAHLGLSRVMMGTGGDEMFYVNLGYGADCLAALELRRLWRFCRACQRTSSRSGLRVARTVLWDGALKTALRQRARSILDVAFPRGRDWLRRRRLAWGRPPWLAASGDLVEALERRLLDTRPVELGPGEGAYVRAMRRLPQSPMFAMELDQGFAWADHAGFRLLFPYLDRDLVDLALRMPPEHLISGGRAKTPLRRLVAEKLPSVGMRARKVSFARMFDGLFRPYGRRAWAALGGPVVLSELGIVDRHGANSLMEDYFGGVEVHGFHAWLMLSTELWLRARAKGPETREHRGVLQ